MLERREPTPPREDGPRPATAPPVFYRSVREFLRQLPGSAQRFWLLVIVTGASAGIGAVLLLWLLDVVIALAWPPAPSFLESVEAASPLRRVLVPALAGVLITLVSLLYTRPLGGHGTAGILEAIWVRKGHLPLARAYLRGALSIIAVGMGASLGREGALLQTGAANGSWLAQRFRLTPPQARLLVACGAASGIAAAYNVPIGGALFGLEVLLGSFALELLGPIVVSTVVATILSRILVSQHPSYTIPAYSLMKPSEVFLGVAFAPFLGIAAAVWVKVMGWVELQLYRLPRWTRPFLPPVGLALVGVGAIWFPELLGNGYGTVNDALLGRLPLRLLVLLPVLKLAATAICAGVGVPGGLFTPSLFYGALVGGALGDLTHHFWPAAEPGAFALVGMAGVLAGTTHAAVSAVLIIFELTGDYGVILPLMLSAALSAVTSRALQPDSLYTAALRRRAVRLPELPRPEWLRSTPVNAIMRADAETVAPGMGFEPLLRKLLSLPPGHDLYVTSRDGRYRGVIQLDALKGNIPDGAHLEMIVAADVMDRSIEPITLSMMLSDVASRFAEMDVERLPVVDGDACLVGTVSKRDVLKRGRF